MTEKGIANPITGEGMKNGVLTEFQRMMSIEPPGSIPESTKLVIEEMLSSCWESLDRESGGMAGYKLKGRTEDLKWNPPLLTFVIERHGGTVNGSGYAELQSWSVDVEAGRATLVDDRRRRWLGGSRNSPLKVGPLAAELANLIKNGKQDPRLKWNTPDEARILIGEVIPNDCPRETLEGRRRRFKKAMQEALEERGWELSTRTNTAKRIDKLGTQEEAS